MQVFSKFLFIFDVNFGKKLRIQRHILQERVGAYAHRAHTHPRDVRAVREADDDSDPVHRAQDTKQAPDGGACMVPFGS